MNKLISVVKGFWSLLVGIWVTTKNFFRKPITVQYPWDKPEPFTGFRGLPQINDYFTQDKLAEKPSRLKIAPDPACKIACPADTDVRGYLMAIADGNYKEGVKILKETYPFSASLGRVCPAFCEGKCHSNWAQSKPLAIRQLKRFLSDYDSKLPESERVPFLEQKPQARMGKIAIIGAGPAGLTCAWELAKAGFSPTVFEKQDKPGGYLMYGIPTYRLPKDVLDEEVKDILKLGVELKTNSQLGKDFTLEDLTKQGYQAIFLAYGALTPMKLGIPGEHLDGVVPGEDFLEKVIKGEYKTSPKRAVVIGGGNTAIDCARTLKRMGCESAIFYRRTRHEMPANHEEVDDAYEEGVFFDYLVLPNKIVEENGKVKGLECIRTKLGDKDASGRRKPVTIPGSEFIYECDLIIPAISRSADTSFISEQIKKTKWGSVEVNENTQETSLKGIYAGGDLTLGPATVVEAIACGKRAAKGIIQQLEAKSGTN